MVEQQIQQSLRELPNLWNHPNALSTKAAELSVLLYNLGDEVTGAELLEHQTLVSYLDKVPEEGGKKLSVAEAEKRALVDTSNEFGRLKLAYQSLVEIIQSIKKKVDIMNQQMKSGI